jgi:hypothetical protein
LRVFFPFSLRAALAENVFQVQRTFSLCIALSNIISISGSGAPF